MIDHATHWIRADPGQTGPVFKQVCTGPDLSTHGSDQSSLGPTGLVLNRLTHSGNKGLICPET